MEALVAWLRPLVDVIWVDMAEQNVAFVPSRVYGFALGLAFGTFLELGSLLGCLLFGSVSKAFVALFAGGELCLQKLGWFGEHGFADHEGGIVGLLAFETGPHVAHFVDRQL